MAADHHSKSKPSLGSPKFTGGPIALKGFDFQRAYALILLVESLRNPDFAAVLCEGAEDVEARFDRDGTVEHHAVQVKGYRVTLSLAREIIRDFQELDKASPGTWKSFTIACTGLDRTLQPIHNLMKDCRSPQSFYDDESNGILDGTRADLERRLVAAELPAEFVIQRVRFETGLPDLARLAAWVRPRVLDTLLSSYPGADYATAKGIYFQLASLVSESTRKPITRLQVESVIEAAISPVDGAIPTCVSAPAPPHRFIGRRDQVDALKDMLTTGGGTVQIALQGMGGIGKTATALQLAAELRPQFPGGIFWGALPDHDGSPRPILQHWAQSCGGEIPSGADLNTLADSVRDLMTDRQTESGPLLTFVDDVRPEWLDAAQVLKRAIPAESPLLLTTRDEQLAVALGTEVRRLDTLPAGESLALLKAHAGAATIDADLAEAAALLEAVGHLPLAIELAGRRLALLARKPGNHLHALRQAIEERAANVLTLPGYPSLAATFDITYEALPEEVQCLFRWMGTFASGPLRVAAVAGVMGWDDISTESALDEFVWLSMLKWGEMVGAYTMHPLLRQYAQARLAEASEADEAQKKHMAYHLAFAQANAQAERSAWDSLEEDLPNLLLAAARAAEVRDNATVVSFEEALLHGSKFLDVRGYYREGIDLFSQSLTVQKALGELQHQPRTLNKLAYFYAVLGQLENAQEHAEAAYDLAHTLGDQEQLADSLHYLGIAFDVQGKGDIALDYFEQELQIRRQAGNLPRLANCLNSLGIMQDALGDYAQVIRYVNEAAAIYEQLGDEQGVAMCIANRGVPELYMGNYAKAMEDFEAALNQSRELNYRRIMALSLLNRGVLQNYCRDYSSALQSLEASLALHQQLGDMASTAVAHSAVAEVYAAQGDYHLALENLHAAEAELRQTGDKHAEIEYLNTLGMVHCEQGDCEEALAGYLRMEELAEEVKFAYFLAQSKLGLARTYLARSGAADLATAHRYAEEAIDLCQRSRLAGSEPRGHAYLGQANVLQGDKEAALQNCREAMDLLGKQEFVHGSEAEIYLITLKVLKANGLEEERQRYLERAYDLVRATAAKIEEEAWRQGYLGAPVNRDILETWARERVDETA